MQTVERKRLATLQDWEWASRISTHQDYQFRARFVTLNEGPILAEIALCNWKTVWVQAPVDACLGIDSLCCTDASCNEHLFFDEWLFRLATASPWQIDGSTI